MYVKCSKMYLTLFNCLLLILMSNYSLAVESGTISRTTTNSSNSNNNNVAKTSSSEDCVDCVSKLEDCTWSNHTHSVDLRSLEASKSHAIVIHDDQIQAMIYVGLCHQLSLGVSSPCGQKNSSICSYNTKTKAQTSYGVFSHLQVLSRKSFALHYKNGDKCPTNSSKTISSVIYFICDLGGELGVPQLLEQDDCLNIFEWKTVIACDAVSLTPTGCAFKDGRTGLEANLTYLSRSPEKSYLVSYSNSNETYNVSVNMCGKSNSFGSVNCSNSIACMRMAENESLSLGSLTQPETVMERADIILKYPSGSKCNATADYNSEFRVVCSRTDQDPTLEVIENCTAKFKWPSTEACQLLVGSHPCTLLTTEHYYDLRSLSSITHAWNVTDNKTNNVYWLNVCYRLPITLNCLHGSAACRCNGLDCVNIGGFEDYALNEEAKGKLVLKYNAVGSLAGGVPSCKSFKTEIKLYCDQRFGAPQLEKVEECAVSFVWKTPEACPVSHQQSTALEQRDGLIYDHTLNFTYNLTLPFSKTYNVTALGLDTYAYIINLANSTLRSDNNCKNASVCQTKWQPQFTRDIGSLRNYQVHLFGSELRLIVTSSNHQRCGKDLKRNVTTNIGLLCSHSGKDEEPTFLYESNHCTYYFTWSLSGVCHYNTLKGNVIPKHPEDHKDHKDKPGSKPETPNKVPSEKESKASHEAEARGEGSSGSTWAVLFALLLVVICVLFVGFVFSSEERRSTLTFRFRRYFGPRTSPSFHYSQQINEDGL